MSRQEPRPTLAQIGQAIGVSAMTARAYVQLGENYDRWLPAYNRAEIAANVNAALLDLEIRGFRRLDEPDAEYEKVAPALLAVLRTIIDVHGIKAPTRVNITTGDDEERPDIEMMRGVREAMEEIAAADRAVIEQGE